MPAALATAFDPLDAGHAESVWLRALEGVPYWKPAPAPLIVVSPHPDDEVLGAGGLMREWSAAGHPVSVISVTDGESAYPSADSLGALRRHELHNALRRLLRVHVPVLRLAIPDGRAHQFQSRIRSAVASLWTPEATLVAPYERDGHPDHDAAGEVCLELARSANRPCLRYPIWRWHHGDPDALQGARWGKFPLSLVTRRAKARAVQCFGSQITPPSREPILPPHMLRYFARPFEAFLL